MLRIIKSPSQYVQGQGLIRELSAYYKQLGQKGAYILADPFVAEHYKEDIVSSFTDVDVHFQIFSGECSENEIRTHIEKMKTSSCDVVIGIGGGKTLDTAKAIAYYAHVPVIVVPTIASTDAPCSALSVLYTDEGEFDKYLFLTSNPNMVIMDVSVIVKAPARLFVAGMGDALATYFEAETCYNSNATSIAGGKPSKTAMALADLCLQTLLDDGLKALLAVEQQVSSEAVENIIEANTYLSGIGFESGGLAGAHAIHNGFTVLEACHHMYHGEKVAFGTLVQLVLENRPMELIQMIITFCKSVGLPVTLAELGLTGATREDIMRVAKASVAEGETIHNSVKPVTAEDVYAAILTADQLGQMCE